MKFKIHEYANLFPLMSETEMEALVADVKTHGLLHPIIRYKGTILDGRNRLRACKKAGVRPRFTDYEGDDPLSMVISLNVQRRDMTAAQRAIVAARALPEFEKEAKKRMSQGGKNKGNGKVVPIRDHLGRSNEQAASVFKVGKNQVSQAKALLNGASDLVEQVEACTISLAAAYEKMQERDRNTIREKKDMAKIKDLSDEISNGRMTKEEALAEIAERTRIEQAQDQAREIWFEGLEETIKWIEDNGTIYHHEYLTSPGTTHNITDKRINEAINLLEQIRDVTLKNAALRKKKGKENGRTRSSRHGKGRVPVIEQETRISE